MARILLVEDNELNRDMLSRRLSRRGHQVVEATDGEAALALAASERPDLILMDMSLPVVDGWEATRRLKAMPATRTIPVIALTAHAMVTDRERSLEAGCDDFDTKPVEIERLLDKIARLLPAGGAGGRPRPRTWRPTPLWRTRNAAGGPASPTSARSCSPLSRPSSATRRSWARRRDGSASRLWAPIGGACARPAGGSTRSLTGYSSLGRHDRRSTGTCRGSRRSCATTSAPRSTPSWAIAS